MTIMTETKGSHLEPKAYTWRGECTQCGGHSWTEELWEGGYRLTCTACGHWVCRHELAGGEHDSEGRYTVPKGRAPVGGRKAPSGCPTVAMGGGWLDDIGSGCMDMPPAYERPGRRHPVWYFDSNERM